VKFYFLARLEIILRLYCKPYDKQYPVICFDERPCFLIGDTIEGLDMEPGKVAKENYSYSKHGYGLQYKRRIISNRAKKITIVLDNLNTHGYSAFYQEFDAELASKLTEKIDFVFTPKSASWLNMIEIEFSALSRQCLNRRIPCMKKLESEVLTFFKERSQKGVKINWQFTQEQARVKLNRRYREVNNSNSKYKIT